MSQKASINQILHEFHTLPENLVPGELYLIESGFWSRSIFIPCRYKGIFLRNKEYPDTVGSYFMIRMH
jgi:hypothetical protein